MLAWFEKQFTNVEGKRINKKKYFLTGKRATYLLTYLEYRHPKLNLKS